MSRDTNAVPDYARLDYYRQRHHDRFVARVRALTKPRACLECHGAGGYVEPVLDDGSGPFIGCGWCEGTGVMLPRDIGLWLSIKSAERRAWRKARRTACSTSLN